MVVFCGEKKGNNSLSRPTKPLVPQREKKSEFPQEKSLPSDVSSYIPVRERGYFYFGNLWEGEGGEGEIGGGGRDFSPISPPPSIPLLLDPSPTPRPKKRDEIFFSFLACQRLTRHHMAEFGIRKRRGGIWRGRRGIYFVPPSLSTRQTGPMASFSFPLFCYFFGVERSRCDSLSPFNF